MSKLFKWILVAVIAIPIIIKGSLWLAVRSTVNQVVENLSPIMKITYGGISSSFDGRVALYDVSIESYGEHLRLANAQLKFSGLRELLDFKETVGKGELPEQLALEIQGLELDINSPTVKLLFAQPTTETEDIFSAFSKIACGDIKHIGYAELLEMGYRTLHSDIEVSYYFNPGAQSIKLNVRADTQNMSDIRVSLSLDNVSRRPTETLSNPPQLSKIAMEVRDDEYQRRVNELCRSKLGLDLPTYVTKAQETLDQALRKQRIAVNQSVLDAYGRYLKDPKVMQVELNPTESISWEGLSFFKAEDVIAMLRPTLSLNKEKVDLNFAWIDPHKGAVVDALDRVIAPETLESEKRTRRYDFVQISDLPQYVGKRLELTTFDSSFYQGTLRKVENGRIHITVLMGTGSAEVSLNTNKINQVRVLR